MAHRRPGAHLSRDHRRAARGRRAYHEAGGPAALGAERDFAAAVQGHLAELAVRRWLADADPEGRPRAEWRMGQHCAAPLIRARIGQLLAAVA